MQREGREWTVWDTFVSFLEITAPATVPDNHIRVYAKDKSGVSALYLKDDAGTEREIGPAATVTGTGATNRVPIWSSASALTSDADLTYVSDVLKAPDMTVSNMTLGSVLFAGTGGAVSQNNARLFWDNTNSRLGIGNTGAAPAFGLHLRHETTSASIAIDAVANSNSAAIYGRGYRGTAGSEAAVQDGDTLIRLEGRGHTGSAFTAQASSRIRALAAETWSGSAQGSYLTLETTPLTSTTRAERFRVGPAGQLGIGGANYGNAGQVVVSGGASAAPSWAGAVNTYTQTYATVNRTLSTYTPDDESSAYAGIDNLQVGSVYATVADLNALRTAYENLRAFAEDVAQMLNGVVDDLQTIGMAG